MYLSLLLCLRELVHVVELVHVLLKGYWLLTFHDLTGVVSFCNLHWSVNSIMNSKVFCLFDCFLNQKRHPFSFRVIF